MMATFNPAGHLAGPPSGQDQSALTAPAAVEGDETRAQLAALQAYVREHSTGAVRAYAAEMTRERDLLAEAARWLTEERDALQARCEKAEKIIDDIATTLLVLGSIAGEQGHFEAGVIDLDEMTTPAERERAEEDHQDALARAVGSYAFRQDQARAAEPAGGAE